LRITTDDVPAPDRFALRREAVFNTLAISGQIVICGAVRVAAIAAGYAGRTRYQGTSIIADRCHADVTACVAPA
jgi:hypothetical protein